MFWGRANFLFSSILFIFFSSSAHLSAQAELLPPHQSTLCAAFLLAAKPANLGQPQIYQNNEAALKTLRAFGQELNITNLPISKRTNINCSFQKHTPKNLAAIASQIAGIESDYQKSLTKNAWTNAFLAHQIIGADAIEIFLINTSDQAKQFSNPLFLTQTKLLNIYYILSFFEGLFPIFTFNYLLQEYQIAHEFSQGQFSHVFSFITNAFLAGWFSEQTFRTLFSFDWNHNHNLQQQIDFIKQLTQNKGWAYQSRKINFHADTFNAAIQNNALDGYNIYNLKNSHTYTSTGRLFRKLIRSKNPHDRQLVLDQLIRYDSELQQPVLTQFFRLLPQ